MKLDVRAAAVSVIEACNFAHKPVTLCGEMAGAPRAFVLLRAIADTLDCPIPPFVEIAES